MTASRSFIQQAVYELRIGLLTCMMVALIVVGIDTRRGIAPMMTQAEVQAVIDQYMPGWKVKHVPDHFTGSGLVDLIKADGTLERTVVFSDGKPNVGE